jgi:hypothetical protein
LISAAHSFRSVHGKRKAKHQLAEIVSEHLGIEGVSVTVLADAVYDWNAFAMAAPDEEPDIHAKMQRAIEALRGQYELQV